MDRPGPSWARRKHGTDNTFWALALKIESAVLHAEPLYGFSVDYAKCFDQMPQRILLELVRELGMHDSVPAAAAACEHKLAQTHAVIRHIGQGRQSSTNQVL